MRAPGRLCSVRGNIMKPDGMISHINTGTANIMINSVFRQRVSLAVILCALSLAAPAFSMLLAVRTLTTTGMQEPPRLLSGEAAQWE